MRIALLWSAVALLFAAAVVGELAACSAFQPQGPVPVPSVTCVVTLEHAPDGGIALADGGR